MDEQLQKLTERIRQAQNILVTVSTNPTVDQLAAAIGLTLALNKLDKHGTAVFSGEVPSTIEFLKPEETLEKNTDSLRDFIIALDKAKADKLRYKVEDQVVRIFITPYRTSLSEKDFNFSQGDFNVDVVVALGVTEQQDLDIAITAHGRILHDATVASISTTSQGSLGTINWVDPTASSLSEMVVNLANGLDKKVLDNQIATALLTGIVASTERFSNDKTTPKTMTASAELMAAGANQQLIATELATPAPVTPEQPEVKASQPEQTTDVAEPEAPKAEPGTLAIAHENTAEEPNEAAPEPEEPKHPQVHVDEEGRLHNLSDGSLPELANVRGGGGDSQPTQAQPQDTEVKRELIIDPPSKNEDMLTANTQPEAFDPPTEELSLPVADSPILAHNESVLPGTEQPASPFTPPPTNWQPPHPSTPPLPPEPVLPSTTLAEIEQSVDSPHAHPIDAAQAQVDVDSARSAVEAALNSPSAPAEPLQPIAALSTRPFGQDLHTDQVLPVPPQPFVPPLPPQGLPPISNAGFSEPTPGDTPADASMDMPLPSNPFGPSQPFTPAPQAYPTTPGQITPGQAPPPPVPPPMLPPLQ